MRDIKLTAILAKVKSFPTMPGAGAKMLALLEEPDTSVSEIEDTLRYDPGLTANVLKLANSAYFGVPSKIGSLKQAVILLGLKRLMQLVVASCVSAIMDKSIPGYDLPAGDMWRHSIAVSLAAEALVNAAKGVPFVVAENMILGTDHAEIGARILAQWNLPADIINAVRWHHDPDASDVPNTQVDVVYLANLLCQIPGTGAQAAGHAIELSPAVIERLGIQLNQFEAISEKVARWVDELSDALAFN
ncbi:MAG: HDOD domain-containing protein [Desulfobacterales bacterium]